MIHLIFGDNQKDSRNYLKSLTENKEIVSFTAENLDLTTLAQVVSSNSFFATDQIIVLESFFTQIKRGKEKDAVLDYLVQHENEHEIILWEGKTLEKSSYKAFKKPSIHEFKLPQHLFAFLESLSPGNANTSIRMHHEVLRTLETEIIFFMLVRQFRLLLDGFSAKDKTSEYKRLAPWQRSKLDKQAEKFGYEKLVLNYRSLFSIDKAQKTGKLPSTLPDTIDFFLNAI